MKLAAMGRVSLLTVLTGLSTGAIVWRLHAQSTDLTPFTAGIRETSYRYPTGEQVRTRDLAIAVTAMGSRVEIRKLVNPAGETVQQRIILDPIRRTRVVIDGLTDSLTTTQLSEQNAARYTTSPVSCTDDPAPRHSTILGYDVVESIEVLNTGSGDMWRTESWAAPALNCFPLREMTYIGKAGGTAVLTNFRETTSILPGSPAASLFEIPSGYTERAPSQVLTEFSRRYPGQATSSTSLSPSDQAYYRQRE